MSASDRVENGKTYKATLKGVPSVSFEVKIDYASIYDDAADVTINPKIDKVGISGFATDPYDFTEVITLPTGNYAVVGRKDGSTTFAHFTLHNNSWWRVFAGSAEAATPVAVRNALEDSARWGVLYEGVTLPTGK